MLNVAHMRKNTEAQKGHYIKFLKIELQSGYLN